MAEQERKQDDLHLEQCCRPTAEGKGMGVSREGQGGRGKERAQGDEGEEEKGKGRYIGLDLEE